MAAALPEEIPVNETIELEGRLRDELGMALDAIVVNAVYPQRFSAADARRLEALDGRGSAEARAAAARGALGGAPRARRARRRRRACGARREAPVFTLPFLFEPDIGPEQLERLARVLERRL